MSERYRPSLRTVLRHLLRGQTRWTEVRIANSDDEWTPPPRFMPPVTSRHGDLLDELADRDEATWASQTLRACLERVRDGFVFEPIAITDAWTEGADAFCLVYTPPWSATPVVGVRGRRGRSPEGETLGYQRSTDDAPGDYAASLVDDISEPLGKIADLLRYDREEVLGWWGVLDSALPQRRG